MWNPFKKKETVDSDRSMRDLLRENLNLVQVDMFDLEDPITHLTPEQRLEYLKYFYDIQKDGRLIERIKYNINRQVHKTMGESVNASQDVAGSININGLAFTMEDVGRLAKLHMKETNKPSEAIINKFAIIPTVDSV